MYKSTVKFTEIERRHIRLLIQVSKCLLFLFFSFSTVFLQYFIDSFITFHLNIDYLNGFSYMLCPLLYVCVYVRVFIIMIPNQDNVHCTLYIGIGYWSKYHLGFYRHYNIISTASIQSLNKYTCKFRMHDMLSFVPLLINSFVQCLSSYFQIQMRHSNRIGEFDIGFSSHSQPVTFFFWKKKKINLCRFFTRQFWFTLILVLVCSAT